MNISVGLNSHKKWQLLTPFGRYLFVEGVCALKLSDTAGCSVQVVVADQTHAVCIALQYTQADTSVLVRKTI